MFHWSLSYDNPYKYLVLSYNFPDDNQYNYLPVNVRQAADKNYYGSRMLPVPNQDLLYGKSRKLWLKTMQHDLDLQIADNHFDGKNNIKLMSLNSLPNDIAGNQYLYALRLKEMQYFDDRR